MNILFVSKHLRFNVATPEHEPLGGTESCLCYLSRALAARGHAVTVLLNLPPGTPDMLHGVRHVSFGHETTASFFDDGQFDAIVTVNAPSEASQFRTVSPRSLHVAWTHLLAGAFANQSARADADCSIYVSHTQRAAYGPDKRAYVIGNSIAPSFENMFASAADLQAAKQNRAAYTSAPYRGLGMLIAVLENYGLDTEVDVYTSMRLYQAADDQFAAMYARARQNPRLHLHGVVPQKILAERLRRTGFLFYTLGIPETFCLAAVEALAAGLDVISTDIGAMKETTLGHAALLPLHNQMQPMEYITGYRALTGSRIAQFKADPKAWAERRFDQVADINRRYSWALRAKEWEEMLAGAISAKAMMGA